MYADRVEVEGKRSVKERLNANSYADSSRGRQITGKRQRQDDKWEHDLYVNDEPQISNRRVEGRDLRLKLQRKGLQPASQGAKGTFPGVRDLREKLSGVISSQPSINNTTKPKSASEAPKPTRRSVAVEASMPETKKVVNPAPTKKQRAGVDGFLRSLGLEKYSITFQAEEVDMTALLHMSDEDLKALGIPMGPRKKILLALESKD
ncbi:SEC23-interacting protein [Rhodamnia argentea]|uniref:SEC23-interacting protein n=1 Tax=Rhodamnia argentea TaxID=178133 RepID=A0ABM3HQA1_9MYRT|nr:SEC23-interacting protein [Rhodamnia argentea]